jgi:hypothetical protein
MDEMLVSREGVRIDARMNFVPARAVRSTTKCRARDADAPSRFLLCAYWRRSFVKGSASKRLFQLVGVTGFEPVTR